MKPERDLIAPEKIGSLVEDRLLKEIFQDEETFTKWLIGNINSLITIVNIPLFDIKKGQRAGHYITDIIATTDDKKSVILELQLGMANHDHFGKLSLYQTLRDANIAIWVAEEFSKEYIDMVKAANEDSKKKKRMYAVKVSVVAITDCNKEIMACSPKFEVLAEPDEEEKIKQEFAGIGEAKIKRRILLQKIREEIRRKEPGLLNFNSGLTNRYTNFGLPEAHLSLIFREECGKIVLSIEFHLEKGLDVNSKRIEEIRKLQSVIEKLVGPVGFGNIAKKKTNFKMWLRETIDVEALNNEMIDHVAQIASQLYNILNPLLTQWKKESWCKK